MVQLLFCIALLVPLVALPIGAFLVSTALGIVAVVVAAVLAAPLALSVSAHLDLIRIKSRYGLSEEELAEFARLVPRLALGPELANQRARERKRSAKEAAVEMIRESRRTAAGPVPEAPRSQGPQRPAITSR